MASTAVTYHADIHAAVRRIPRGRVATYGQIADLAGIPGRARQVGYALAALPDHTTVPWHRVVNARGELSLARAAPGGGIVQRHRLEDEGVEFGAYGSVELKRYRWKPRRGAAGGGERNRFPL
jgi:methylated-DNA-protein-cysteine methyltransferase-like protein